MKNYYLVRAKYGGLDDKTEEFLKKSYWQNTYTDGTYSNIINNIKKDDILFLTDGSYIKYYAKCKNNPKNGRTIYTDNWTKLKDNIYFKPRGSYTHAIVKINKQSLIKQLDDNISLQEVIEDFFISSLTTYDFMSLKNGNIRFSNINIFIGENGSGKSQILKLLYAVLLSNNQMALENENSDYEKKRVIAKNLIEVFKPDKLGNLVNIEKKETKISIDFFSYKISFKFGEIAKKEVSKYMDDFDFKPLRKKTVFIPTKEPLSFYKGFRILYEERYLEFDKTYYELARVLEKPLQKQNQLSDIAEKMEKILNAKVKIIDGRFYLIKENKRYEMHLVAEGYRKIALLYYLLSNSALDNKSILFWDEPEANMHPKLIDDIVQFLVILANKGMQIFISTHSPYVIESFNNHLKKFKIRNKKITDNDIKNIEPLDPKNLKAYLLKEKDYIELLDDEIGLIDDKLLHNFNHLTMLYDKMRDIEFENR